MAAPDRGYRAPEDSKLVLTNLDVLCMADRDQSGDADVPKHLVCVSLTM